MTGIYLIKNLVNGKKYIGQSVDIQRRKKEHKYICSESNQSLKRAYNKYGYDNFSFEVLEECDKSLLDEREIFWIEKLKPEYNRTRGGRGVTGISFSEETKEKLREAGKKQWNSKTEEEKAQIIKNNLKGPQVGHSVSEETREKLRNANLGKKQSQETIKKRCAKLKGRHRDNSYRNKPVICIETGEVFKSIKDANEKYGLSTLCGHLKGKYKTCKGKHYRYL